MKTPMKLWQLLLIIAVVGFIISTIIMYYTKMP
jgi:hypothetical protein